MSRSYKKRPGFSDGDCSKKFSKRQANKKVRRTLELDSGGAYKKVYQQWFICDNNWRYYSRSEVIRDIERWGFFKDNPYRYWIK